MTGFFKLIAALFLSIVIHTVAAQFGLIKKPDIMIAGGAVVDVASFGNAFDDMVSKGGEEEVEDVIEADVASELVEEENDLEEVVEEVQPELIEEAEVVDQQVPEEQSQDYAKENTTREVSDQVKPTNETTSQEVKNAAKTAEVNEQRPDAATTKVEHEKIDTAAQPASVASIVPLDEVVEHEKPELAEIPVTRAVEAEAEPIEVAALTPNEPVRAAIPELNPLKSVVKQDPVKEPKKATKKKPAPKKNKKSEKTKKKQKKNKAQTQKQKNRKSAKKKTRRKRGDQGNDRQSGKRGVQDGSKNVKSSRKGSNKRSSTTSGNASISNYRGKVQRRISRKQFYPKEAKRKRIRGRTVVAFVISRNGSVSGIRVTRSSGSSILDNAAILTVKKAAPFPTIPKEFRKAKWPFQIPLAYN